MIRYIFIVMLSVVIAQETNKETIRFNSANPFSFEEIIMDLDILIDSKQSELEIAKGVDMETYYKIKKELEELLAKQKGGA